MLLLQVTINICDCNDNGPVVSAPGIFKIVQQLSVTVFYYDAIDDGSCIVENSPTGTIVRTFTSTDADTATDNTDHVYVIESGGLDAAGTVSCYSSDNRSS